MTSYIYIYTQDQSMSIYKYTYIFYTHTHLYIYISLSSKKFQATRGTSWSSPWESWRPSLWASPCASPVIPWSRCSLRGPFWAEPLGTSAPAWHWKKVGKRWEKGGNDWCLTLKKYGEHKRTEICLSYLRWRNWENIKKKQYIIVMWNPTNENMNKYRDNRIEIGYYDSV